MIWKCWDEDAAPRCFSPHAVYTAVLSDSPGTSKGIISSEMQQLEIAGNLCHSVLSSSCENRAFLEPVSQSSLRLVRDAPVYSAWLAASHQHDGVSSNSSTWQPPISFSLTAMLLAFCKRTGSVCCHKLSQWLMSSSTLPRPSQCLCHGTALQLLSSKRLLGFTLVSPSSTQVCLSAGGVFHAYNPL